VPDAIRTFFRGEPAPVRLGIRTKQIAGVTAIVGTFVLVLSAVYISRLAGVVLGENQKTAELLANQIYSSVRLVVPRALEQGLDPYEALRDDADVQSALMLALYGELVTGAAIVDTAENVVVSVGAQHAARPDLNELVNARPWDQLRALYTSEGQTYELRHELTLDPDNERFGSIRVGISTVLVRNAVEDLFRRALYTGAGALVVAIILSGLMAQLLLRPIHVIRSGLTRLGKGEFGVTLDLPPGDEFGELGSYFNTVSQQLSADRLLLAGQKANLQSAVEHLEDAVALFGPTGQLLFSNPAMQPLLPHAAMGRALQGLLPDAHPYRTLVEETLASRSSRGPVQVSTAQLADGEHGEPDEGELLVMTHAVAGTDGRLVGVLLVARNLTHLTRVQSTLAYSRKLVALGRLTAGIAHEVKNPLNAMMIHLELLRTKIRHAAQQPEPVGAAAGTLVGVSAGVLPPLPAPFQSVLEHVAIIESEIRRLDEVVQGFLKFTRPEELRLQPVRVSELFDEILPVIQAEAAKTAVRVLAECPAELPPVNGDAAMLRQVFLNLAINACQAMPEGGTLRLVATPSPLDRIEIRVEDTGVGIPPEHLGKIFDLYFTTKHHGTGIGLSMVYRIVQLHDGEIEVRSTPGHGTTFHVLLPRAFER
jgi:signal transduction histidine kinase